MCAAEELRQLSLAGSGAVPISRHVWGRTFLHPVSDYLLIGGGLSLLVIPLVMLLPNLTPTNHLVTLSVFLALNYAHFAASTVRFYTKQGVAKDHWFVAYVAPLIALAVVTVGVIWPKQIGDHIWALGLTWSPYHYAAQAYGLAVIYGYRSNVTLSASDKRLIWWVAMLPFFRAFLIATDDSGMGWFVSESTLAAIPLAVPVRNGLADGLAWAMFGLPMILSWRVRLPLISFLLLIANGVWWFFLAYKDAWFWATVFHSIQYLAIVLIVHVQDQKRPPKASPKSGLLHAARFYFASWFLGALLFLIVPFSYQSAGFESAETFRVVWAAVNIHHFIVDGYIWRAAKKKP
jgi:hypothetical protein